MPTLATLAEVAARLDRLLTRRDSLIAKAITEGHSSREVAEACGLTHTGVLKIARR